MERIGYVGLLATCTAVLILLVSQRTSASDSFDFSGKYVSEQDAFGVISTLEVIQDNEGINITRMKLGKRTVSRYPLDGSDGEYMSPDGVSGKCKAKLKPKYL